MSAIVLQNVSKRFGNVEVCRDINLNIVAGEFMTLLGSSGCGKTTTLNMIAGLEDISSGDILIDGRRVNDLPPVDRNAAMVFQNYALYPHMTVEENIGFALRLKGVSRPEIAKRVAPIAASLELSHVLHRRPAQLSGGQQQRVAIGRAIIRSPKVFLFDEPFSNLDAALRMKMRSEVKELHNRLGVTSVFVTHDQEEAMSISDRIAVMRQGIVEQVGTPEDIYARPASTYVATFIGSPQVEILQTTRSGSGLRVGALTVPLSASTQRIIEQHRTEIDVAIRPEHLRIGGLGTPAKVRLTQPIGPATLVTLDWDGGTCNARLTGLVKLALGTPVCVEFEPDAVMLFDRSTGRRLTAEA